MSDHEELPARTSEETAARLAAAKRLGAQLDGLAGQMRAVEATMVEENIKRDKRIRTNRIAMILLGIALVIALAVAVVATKRAADAQDAADDAATALAAYKTEIAASRVASCQQFNIQNKREIEAAIYGSHGFVETLATISRSNPNPPPDLEERIDRFRRQFNSSQDEIIRAGHPDRDCTPAGIEAYLTGKGGFVTTTKKP